MRISQTAFNKLIAHEVTSKARYEKVYQRPILPGAASGITVGIGYDLGYHSVSQIKNDWGKLLPASVVSAMQACSGLTQAAARRKLPWAKKYILVPWTAALAEFETTELPRWEAKTAAALPGADRLPPDCFGALVSLTFNRGASYSKAGARYKEMRAIKAALVAGKPYLVPAQLRSMKRLWPSLQGLQTRREDEAKLFEKGLKSLSNSFFSSEEGTQDQEEEVIDMIEEKPHIAENDPRIKAVQEALDAIGYHEVGLPNGELGSRTTGAIAAFMFDRGLPGEPIINDELMEQLGAAQREGWERPISPDRAASVPSDSKVIKSAERQSWLGWIFAGVGGGGLADWLLERFDSTRETVQALYPYMKPIKGLFVDYWPVLVVGIGGFILYQAIIAKKERIDDHQKGKLS